MTTSYCPELILEQNAFSSHRLYCGSLVHGLCRQLLASASVDGLLSLCPEAKQLYEQLFSATQHCAPAELLLPKSQSNSKKKKRKKRGASRSEKQVEATPGTMGRWGGSNRFGLLTAEDPEGQTEASELE